MSRPLPIRIFNQLGIRTQLGENQLIQAARSQTGLADFGDDYWLPNLRRLIQGIEEEARLHPWGRFITRQRLVNLLSNRLRAAYYFKKYPHILEQTLKPQVVITGLQRTGTTLLQRLLASHPAALSVQSWEALNPAPMHTGIAAVPYEAKGNLFEKDLRKRKQMAHLSERVLRYMAPDFFAIHPVEHDAPEEEVLLLDISFLSTVPEATMLMPRYAAWLQEQDQTPAYEYLRKLLLLLQWQKKEGTHWILKTPHHLEWLETLTKVFPEARILHTHREPLQTLASFLSMAWHGMQIFSEYPSRELVGAYWSQKIGYMVQRAIAFRQRHEGDSFLDVPYQALMQDPISLCRQIHDFAGLDWSAETETKLRAYLDHHPQHRFGVHRYRLEDFGIAEASVKPLFEGYY